MIHRFSFPTPIFFGAGARNGIGDHLKTKNLKKPLLVTDRALAKLAPCEEVKRVLKNSALEVSLYSEIWGNPVKSQVTAGVQSYKSNGCDCIVGLGGGAALDVAKAIALMIHHPGDLFDYEDDMPGALPVDKEIPYWIAIPTTAGTGSEVGRSSVISDDETHRKKIIFSPRMLAQIVFADPELTFDLPPKMTAATGVDALTHCVEAYLAKNYHPICDGIALEGIKLCAKSLVKATKDGKNLEARSDMLLASMMGAIAFQKGLGVTHSCAHALGTVLDMHHGLANGIMIDHALSYNLETVPEKFSDMAQAAKLKSTDSKSFINYLTALKQDLGIPNGLKGIATSDHLKALCDIAIEDACHPNNPRACTRESFEGIFKRALEV